MTKIWICRLFVSILVLVTIIGCSRDSLSVPTASPNDTSARGESGIAQAVPEDIYKLAATITYSNKDGDRAEGSVLFGKPQTIAQADSMTGSTFVSQCMANLQGVTPSRSMVVPFRVTVKLVSAVPAALKVLTTSILMRSSPKATCSIPAFGSFSYLANMAEAQPMKDYVYDGFIPVGNVITPNHPEGDPGKMRLVGLAPSIMVGFDSLGSKLSGDNVCRGVVYVTRTSSSC